LKQATYVREQNTEARVYLFYIDIRAHGKLEDFYTKVQSDKNVTIVKGKVAKIIEDPGTKDLIVEAEDIISCERIRIKVDLVVLATGMVPTCVESKVPANISYDENGFIVPHLSGKGIYATGCAKRPMDVASSIQDATGAALKTIQSIVGVATP
jgi:quinone-modifying oxidoreductase subunit QmoA